MCNDLPSQRPLKVLLVTSWNTPCGIAEYARLLKESAEKADPRIAILPDSESLDPAACFSRLAWSNTGRNDGGRYDVVHLNHHDGLHSRWQAGQVQEITETGVPVLVTYHDTRERLVDCHKLNQLIDVASSVVVHEPVEGAHVIYWRQGVPAAATMPARYSRVHGMADWINGEGVFQAGAWKAYPQQPVLGTVGFNFPWKNYDKLAQVTGEEGWALVILSNNATPEDEARWKSMNSSILVVSGFQPQEVVVNYLAGCDATAFMYECANTGTSGAIRQGLAARKPVIAYGTCRQFRDLWGETCGVFWVPTWDGFRHILSYMQPAAWDAPVSAWAHAESWDQLGRKYAKLYRMLAGRS
jgi:glycosyltransferase involved in cell wall biosynthesis